MKRITPIAFASVLTILVAFAATHVRAQESSEKTFLTFSSPVELPGITLEPGTYVFRLADTPARDVVQVLRKDDTKPIGQWTFVQAERPKVTDDTVVMFKETGRGTAPAVQYWFYPAEKVGKEFVYPKNQAQRIAARTGQTVQSEDGPVSPESAFVEKPSASSSAAASAAVTSESRRDVDGSGAAPVRAPARDSRNLDQQDVTRDAPAANAAASTTASQPAAGVDTQARESRNVDQDPIAQAPSARPAPVAPERGQQVARADQLPDTASPIPLIGMIGALSLVGAAVLRRLRRG